jgi:hypothetical protein
MVQVYSCHSCLNFANGKFRSRGTVGITKIGIHIKPVLLYKDIVFHSITPDCKVCKNYTIFKPKEID